MSNPDVAALGQEQFADWISDLNDLYVSASEAEIAEKVRQFRDFVAHELAEKICDMADRNDMVGHELETLAAMRAADLIDPEVTP